VDDGSVHYFPICQETLRWQPNNIAKMLSLTTDTTYIRCTSARKRMAISWSSMRVNTANDASISCQNIVKFGSVTPELIELICERLVRHGQKLAYLVEYLRIYWTDFHNLFNIYESSLRADDGSVPNFPIYEVTLPWQPNDIAIMKAN